MVHSASQNTHREADGPVVDWIGWGGGARPVDKYAIVTVRRRDGASLTDTALKFDWSRLPSGNDPSDVVAYRLEMTAPDPMFRQRLREYHRDLSKQLHIMKPGTAERFDCEKAMRAVARLHTTLYKEAMEPLHNGPHPEGRRE